MDEYIKREDAISAVCLGCNLEFSDRHCEPPDCEIRHAINAVPAADVVEVVRCKDCKWYQASELLAPNKFCFRLKHPTEDRRIGYNFADDDFCSYGERKSDNGSNSTGH